MDNAADSRGVGAEAVTLSSGQTTLNKKILRRRRPSPRARIAVHTVPPLHRRRRATPQHQPPPHLFPAPTDSARAPAAV